MDTETRLTHWNGKKYVLPQGHGSWRNIADRLAAYENSGVEPEKLGSSLYKAVPNVNGDITITLTEEERCVILNALSRTAMNKEDIHSRTLAICDGVEDEEELRKCDKFLHTCELIAKLSNK